MKRILVPGGPVHAFLDAVKIITNRFKGGLMCQLVEDFLAFDCEIVYLCAPTVGAKTPRTDERIQLVTHGGFDEYRSKVLELAPKMDGIILGAAVANLIPEKPFLGKFPSHHYQPGEVIPINFTIAPRVIDVVKEVAPRAHLFGYKLLSGVPVDELIRSAYSIVLEAHATAVFANDALLLDQKYAVTKERGIHPLTQDALAAWIWEMLNDTYYTTVFIGGPNAPESVLAKVRTLIQRYAHCFLLAETGLIFGTVAVRYQGGFVTTCRGKRELDSLVTVVGVDHGLRKVMVSGNTKASLNAPLLAKLFENPLVESIVHYHQQVANLPSYPYAPPGTTRDSLRSLNTSFKIEEHGCMLLFNQAGRQL